MVYFRQDKLPNPEKESIIDPKTIMTNGSMTPFAIDPNIPMQIKIQSTLVAH